MKMGKETWFIAAVLISIVAFTIDCSLAQDEKVMPEKHLAGAHVIRIQSDRGIIPPSLSVKPGATVIWVNESKSLIEILFPHKKITVSCQSPVNFMVDVDGSFVSNKIGLGAVASICFIEKGAFDFIVKKLSPGKSSPADEFKGKIIVEQ
jgi:plastocyanin